MELSNGYAPGAAEEEIYCESSRIGPYFPDFSLNRTTIRLKIEKICPRFPAFSLRSLLPRRLLATSNNEEYDCPDQQDRYADPDRQNHTTPRGRWFCRVSCCIRRGRLSDCGEGYGLVRGDSDYESVGGAPYPAGLDRVRKRHHVEIVGIGSSGHVEVTASVPSDTLTTIFLTAAKVHRKDKLWEAGYTEIQLCDEGKRRSSSFRALFSPGKPPQLSPVM